MSELVFAFAASFLVSLVMIFLLSLVGWAARQLKCLAMRVRKYFLAQKTLRTLAKRPGDADAGAQSPPAS